MKCQKRHFSNQTEKCKTEKYELPFFCLTFFCLIAEWLSTLLIPENEISQRLLADAAIEAE